jgi:hypothetical protein
MPYHYEGERLVFDARTLDAPIATVEPGEMPQPGDPDPDAGDEEDDEDDEGEDDPVSA